jgi:hypothetical protein
MLGLFYPYGIFLQAIAILHFVRRRPDTFWLWIILVGGGLGALAYIFMEILPDARLLHGAYQVFPRRKRIRELEGLVSDNPSVGNYEELGDQYLDDQQFARARECFDTVIAKTDTSSAAAFAEAATIDPFYRRALCEIALDDVPSAVADLEQVVARDEKYDYQRAAGLLAYALGMVGKRDRADALFAAVLQTSTLTETQYNYACFLAATGREGEAREWAARILRKKATMPDYIRRGERPWFRKAGALLKRLPLNR